MTVRFDRNKFERALVESASRQVQRDWSSFRAEVVGLPEDEIRRRAALRWDGELSDDVLAGLSRGDHVELNITIKR